MVLWAYVEVKLACKELHSVVLKHTTWYCIRFRVYKQLESKCITAIPLNAETHVACAERCMATVLESDKTVVPIVDHDTYVTRRFFVREKNHKVTVDDVAYFRAEIPALPSVLATSALFVEAELIRSPGTSYGYVLTDTQSCNGGLPELVDAKVFRIANLASDTHEYYPCNFDGSQINAVLHLVVDTAVVKFGVAAPVEQRLVRKPCTRYREWRRIIRSSSNKQVRKWFMESNYQENAYYEGNVSATTSVRTPLPQRMHSEEHSEETPTLQLAGILLRTFIAQVLDGDHSCGALFGIDWDPDPPLRHPNGSDHLVDMVMHDHHTLSMAACTLIYICAKVIAETAISIGSRDHVSTCGDSKGIACGGNAENIGDFCTQCSEKYSQEASQAIFDDCATLSFHTGEPKVVEIEDLNSCESLFRPVTNDRMQVELCRRLNRINRSIGIQKCKQRKVLIAVRRGIQIVFDEIYMSDISYTQLDTSIETVTSKLLSGLYAWLCLKWDHVAPIAICKEVADHMHVERYCEEQMALFNKVADPEVDESEMIAILRSIKITDEHHFFVANCFPFVRQRPTGSSRFEAPRDTPRDSNIHVIVLVHGYNGSPVTMRFVRNTIVAFTNNTYVLVAQSLAEDSNTSIDHQGGLLAQEVDVHLRRKVGANRVGKLSFIAHSLGGVVVRAALRHLTQYHCKLHALISLSSPHLGVPSVVPRFIGAHCLPLASYMRSPCVSQLLLVDGSTIRKSFLYELSGDDSIRHFRIVKLVGILQDYISPPNSCLLDQSLTSVKCPDVDGMCHRVLRNLRGTSVHKLFVDYTLATKFVRWKAVEAHLHIIDRALLARYFFFITYDIF